MRYLTRSGSSCPCTGTGYGFSSLSCRYTEKIDLLSSLSGYTRGARYSLSFKVHGEYVRAQLGGVEPPQRAEQGSRMQANSFLSLAQVVNRSAALTDETPALSVGLMRDSDRVFMRQRQVCTYSFTLDSSSQEDIGVKKLFLIPLLAAVSVWHMAVAPTSRGGAALPKSLFKSQKSPEEWAILSLSGL